MTSREDNPGNSESEQYMKNQTKENRTVPRKQYDAAINAIAALPNRHADLRNQTAAINAMKDTISGALENGHSYAELAKLLTNHNIVIKAPALKRLHTLALRTAEPESPSVEQRPEVAPSDLPATESRAESSAENHDTGPANVSSIAKSPAITSTAGTHKAEANAQLTLGAPDPTERARTDLRA